MIKKALLSQLFLMPMLVSIAQTNSNAEMADTFRSNGKIYVVVAVMLVILAGLILYLIRLDRKISKLEKNP
jgi:uncharacterized membrane protein